MSNATMVKTATRAYHDYAQPLWRRVLFTREMAVVGILIAVYIGAVILVPNFSAPITITYLLLDVAASSSLRCR